MDITAISDLHGHFPKDLPGGDVLILAGDYTGNDYIQQWDYFYDWLSRQPYTKKVFIAGNHDNQLADKTRRIPQYCDAEYLEDSGIEFMGVKIYGSPWTKTFEGMNPKYKAFTVDTEAELEEKWEKIPKEIDILVTHSPPFGMGDEVFPDKKNVGSTSLLAKSFEIRPEYHLFGHVHEGYGHTTVRLMTFINCSYVDQYYHPINKPVRLKEYA